MASNKTIHIEGNGRRLEYDAGGAITPGHLCYLASDGDVEVHATAGGTHGRLFAIENDLEGDDIDDAYASGERVQLVSALPGDFINAFLANGENAAIGSYLESAGDGTLRVVDSDTSVGDIGVQSVVGYALEALDFSDSSGADPSSSRIKICVI